LLFKLSKCISTMSSHRHLQITELKKLLILSVNNLLCYFSHFVVWHENARIFGKILTKAKWKWKLKWNISSLWHSTIFTLEFGLVWNLGMWWKFFPCSCMKISWIGSFSFGDVNNVLRCLVKFFPGPMII
jgi:hypothetical protein